MTKDQSGRVAALTWGVKLSFRNYVESTGGTVAAAAGAERTPEGVFTFADAGRDGLHLDAAGQLSGRGDFAGEVQFSAHGGMLSVYLADPAVEIGSDGAVLTVADSAARTRRLTVATLDLSAMTSDRAEELSLPAVLTLEGGQLLGDHYPPMTLVDPVRLTLVSAGS